MEMASTSNTRFDFALYDLHRMKMPSTSNTHLEFDFASDYLDWLLEKWCWQERRLLGPPYRFDDEDVRRLKKGLRYLKTFAIWARKGRSSKVLYLGDERGKRERLGCMLSSIQHLVSSIPNRIHSGAEITKFWEQIMHFRTEIKALYIIFLDDLDHCSLGDPDPGRLTDLIDSLIDSLSHDLSNIHIPKAPKRKLMFLKNFISFATMQLQDGVEHIELTDLLLHVEFVALSAALLFHIRWLDWKLWELWVDWNYELVREKMPFEISQLINPANADPSVRQTYIRVLAVSKLTRLSYSFTLEKNSHTVVANFIDSLVDNLMDLLDSCTSFVLSVKNQLKMLYDNLTFLKILLQEPREKVYALDDEMKDLIGVVVCDAGILIFSLSVNEMKEGLTQETDIALFHLHKVVQFIMAEIYAPNSSSSFSFPMTNELGSLDFLLENLRELVSCEADSIVVLKDQINTVQEDLSSIKSFLETIVEQRNSNEKLQALWSRIMGVAYKAEFVIDSLLVGDKTDCSLSLDTITEEIKSIKTEADSVKHDSHSQAQKVVKTSTHMPSQVSTSASNEVLVGLKEEVETIIGGLTRESMQLDIVSIVGMPGLGKTTFANKVYNDPRITGHFHVRAWCTVSQVYSWRRLLLKILADIVSGKFDIVSDKFLNMNDDDLAEKLYQHLKGKRYLIVLDDVWDIEAWNLMKRLLPDDTKGSRILFTSRFHSLSSQFKLNSMPYHLRPLTHEESWILLQSKLFRGEGCPPALSVVGNQIAKDCKGLPLTVVVVAGILASTKQDCWTEVARNLSSSTVIEDEHCMKTLDLSYRHLPNHLKSCLLYFGAFKEDEDIPVRRLLRLWIAEGFVRKSEVKSLEDVANEYLMDLIGRSLVLAIQERSTSGAKTCRIHDLLHEFCMVKAKEESFIHIFHGYNEHFTCHRLCITDSEEKPENLRIFCPHLRSLFSSTRFDYANLGQKKHSFILRISKLLRVLHIKESFQSVNFLREIELLVHLRYLAIRVNLLSSISSGIANLSRLETLLIEGGSVNVALPNTIWDMKKLRHLCARTRYHGLYGNHHIGFVLPIDDLDSSADLCHLDTFTLAIDPSSQSMQQIMRKLPSIRRLKCVDIAWDKFTGNYNGILALHFLSQLESLKVVGFRGIEFAFPLNLKKLTLSRYSQPWSKISTIGMLPNLEVLKLLDEAFMGETWEIKEGEFPQLKVLKLEKLDIVMWTASCDNFPPLQKLILESCSNLEEVPSSCLGEIETVKRIEVRCCHPSAVSLVKQIQEEQTGFGNDCLEVVIFEEEER